MRVTEDEARALGFSAKKPSKYRAKPERVDGRRFASKREARRYRELLLLERTGRIRQLACQPRFVLAVPVLGPVALSDYNAGRCSNHHRVIGEYVADFRYEEIVSWRTGTWRLVIEDAKGVRTPVYQLKRRMFEAQYGVEIREV